MIDKTEFAVTGDSKIHCGGCEGKISFALLRMPSLRTVTVGQHTAHCR